MAHKRKDDEREARGKRQETEAYFGLGHAYTRNNQIQTAIECYEKTLKIAKERGDKQQEIDAYFALGDAYRLNNQFQTAIEYYSGML